MALRVSQNPPPPDLTPSDSSSIKENKPKQSVYEKQLDFSDNDRAEKPNTLHVRITKGRFKDTLFHHTKFRIEYKKQEEKSNSLNCNPHTKPAHQELEGQCDQNLESKFKIK